MPLRFGDFILDAQCCQLLRDGAQIHLSPKAFRLLEVLIDHSPAVVTKQQLLDEVWEGQIVEEENIKNLIAELRKALRDDRSGAPLIRTAHRRGYAFCGEVRAADRQPSPMWFLDSGDDVYPIRGSAVIGRNPDCEIRMRSGSVSRLHARLTISPSGVMIEDLGSRNGTVVAGQRIDQPTAVVSGDVIKIGTVAFTLRHDSQQTSTIPLLSD
jgi:DNA-binding winged helix-turn-helix (wHTH) protein